MTYDPHGAMPQAAVDAVRRGASANQAALDLNVDPHTVAHWLSAAGVERPHTPRGWWTAERDDTLRALWAEEHSTAEIGRRMGTSKNAVVGRSHRLHLTSRPSPIIVDGKPRPPRPPRVTGPTLPPLRVTLRVVAPRPVFVAPVMVVPEAVPSFPPGKCRYLIGARFHYLACDEPTVAMRSGKPSPYCKVHHALCYLPKAKVAEAVAA